MCTPIQGTHRGVPLQHTDVEYICMPAYVAGNELIRWGDGVVFGVRLARVVAGAGDHKGRPYIWLWCLCAVRARSWTGRAHEETVPLPRRAQRARRRRVMVGVRRTSSSNAAGADCKGIAVLKCRRHAATRHGALSPAIAVDRAQGEGALPQQQLRQRERLAPVQPLQRALARAFPTHLPSIPY